jgi:tetratricopeptide (TPR) repeat protein
MLDLADIEFVTEKYEECESILGRVLAAQSEHRRGKQLHGACLFRMGKVDEARGVLESALSLNPSPQVVHYYLGLIAEQKGEKDKALEHYRESLKRFVEAGGGSAAGEAK